MQDLPEQLVRDLYKGTGRHENARHGNDVQQEQPSTAQKIAHIPRSFLFSHYNG